MDGEEALAALGPDVAPAGRTWVAYVRTIVGPWLRADAQRCVAAGAGLREKAKVQA